ncbi:DUF4386 domain-containing protein [Plectonema cf. radiosum LEGE 06105]|uniref:DUF4386 domain-containing protein n=1 Tax=Plectonema cf. radiosum LEGE 06105 TaxID=945769 RepID=A0A8J7FAM7_9CYAN|nr:DUF4386 domain-containing protein [Plectonema radiosum]MBE9214789.1 DUF4386 domain-containing protein [Plectonema cf. radiosum LEGE 06105]
MSTSPSMYRITALLLIIESLLLFIPIIVLGQAIDWPASLSQPASKVLPLLVEQSQPVFIGYFTYLIYSVLFYPISLLTIQILKSKSNNNPYLNLAVGFGIASMICRTLGIIRWLAPMPLMAKIYVQPSTSETTRTAIDVVYQALNQYGGSIGEVLGVSLFTTLWLIIVSLTILKTRILPRWLGMSGFISSMLLTTQLVELFGIDTGSFIAVSVSVFQIWLLAMGIVCLLRSFKFKNS